MAIKILKEEKVKNLKIFEGENLKVVFLKESYEEGSDFEEHEVDDEDYNRIDLHNVKVLSTEDKNVKIDKLTADNIRLRKSVPAKFIGFLDKDGDLISIIDLGKTFFIKTIEWNAEGIFTNKVEVVYS
jgi:hypothetical protein